MRTRGRRYPWACAELACGGPPGVLTVTSCHCPLCFSGLSLGIGRGAQAPWWGPQGWGSGLGFPDLGPLATQRLWAFLMTVFLYFKNNMETFLVSGEDFNTIRSGQDLRNEF